MRRKVTKEQAKNKTKTKNQKSKDFVPDDTRLA